jgi:hypothetical protein
MSSALSVYKMHVGYTDLRVFYISMVFLGRILKGEKAVPHVVKNNSNVASIVFALKRTKTVDEYSKKNTPGRKPRFKGEKRENENGKWLKGDMEMRVGE